MYWAAGNKSEQGFLKILAYLIDLEAILYDRRPFGLDFGVWKYLVYKTRNLLINIQKPGKILNFKNLESKIYPLISKMSHYF